MTLLTDQQIQSFLINGFISIETKLDKSFHDKIYEDVSKVISKEGNPGNNIYPRVKDLLKVYEDDNIKGAITSILGGDYIMQPHRFTHITKPGTKDQLWHKDSYFGFKKELRYNQPWNVMAMYYPQDTTQHMGPTAIKPKTQYGMIDPKRCPKEIHNQHSKSSPSDIFFNCKAGSVLIIHYDLVHRGTQYAAGTGPQRLMFKFQFTRTKAPIGPTWNHNQEQRDWDAKDAKELQPVVKCMWDWMLGETPINNKDAPMKKLKAILNNSKFEEERLGAAYQFACSGDINCLLDIIQSKNNVEHKQGACSCFSQHVPLIQIVLFKLLTP
ncbi:hypothetical protein AKO1_014949 [Acrasis kona]|uniref:Phytanoyl-CoA dioxygenase n=1 Tax=Acrasis kona TaxID=1008807 RepID=A0AAW2Z175_9EUKA